MSHWMCLLADCMRYDLQVDIPLRPKFMCCYALLALHGVHNSPLDCPSIHSQNLHSESELERIWMRSDYRSIQTSVQSQSDLLGTRYRVVCTCLIYNECWTDTDLLCILILLCMPTDLFHNVMWYRFCTSMYYWWINDVIASKSFSMLNVIIKVNRQ